MFDLDVDSPGKVGDVLRHVAQAYRESASELQSAWQDRTLRVWDKLADVLDRAANQCDRLATEN